MTDQTFRRLFGASFSAALGLTFGLTSQAINPLAIPGVTFHQPPLGMWGNIVGSMAVCGLIGLIVAWWNSSFTSIIIAAPIVALGVELVGTLYNNPIPPERIGPPLLTIVILLLPMTGFFGAIFVVLRWLINKQVEYRHDRDSWARRLLLPGLIIIIVGGLGATSLYSAEGQQRVKEMNALLQASLQAADVADLPPAFAKFADTFQQRATPDYTLQWVRSDLIEWRISQPAGYQDWQFSIVAARFANGWILACLFAPGETPSNCRAYDRDPTLAVPVTP